MPRTCTVCRHPKREEIDQALLQGVPLRSIAGQARVSTTALHRHKTDHIPRALMKAHQVTEQVRAETLLERLQGLNRETTAILAEARVAKNNAIALQAIARAEKQLELEARLLGELNESAKVAVGINIAPKIDLSLLTDEELAQLAHIQKRLFGTRDGL